MKIFVSSGGAGPEAGFGAGGPDAARGVLLARFLPVLRRLGSVTVAGSAAEGVRLAREAGADAVHLCLALPHELPPDAGVETVPVFGLGRAECPPGPFGGDARTDWRLRLGCSGGAICLSTHAAEAVRALVGEACPVAAIPPPVAGPAEPVPPAPTTFGFTGAVLDTAEWADTGPVDRPAPAAAPAGGGEAGPSSRPGTPPPAWRKTTRYRLGVARLHMAYLYREVVRDLLPTPMAALADRAGHAGVAAARAALRRRGTGGAVAGEGGGDDSAWRKGRHALSLDGLVFAAVHGPWDRSWGDALSAFVEVCRDDPGATLAIKTAGLDAGTRAGLAGTLRRLGPFACRVVILDGTVEGDGLAALVDAAAFYLCASPAEAAPLPVARFLAAGRPAVAPDHSALADFIDETTGFVVGSGPEYESWPGDVEERLAATGWRLEWEGLCAGVAAARRLSRLPDAYAARGRAVAARTAAWCGEAPVLAALTRLLAPAPLPAAAVREAGRPLILVHSETNAGTLADRLGMAEYSYFFVLRFFRPVLERIGRVVEVADPAREVDRLAAAACARGEPCVYLSFAPPHRTVLGLACPTIPVFAWEFDSIPHEHWGGETRHDWARVLRELGGAIVHSEATVRTVRAALGEDFPVRCIPAPVWDEFAPQGRAPSVRQATLFVRGTVLDTRAIDMAGLRHDENWLDRVGAERTRRGAVSEVALDGVVYSSVFNPEDGRKNWTDMLAAFCRVFAAEAGATLVLKLTHHDGAWPMALMLKHLWRMMPFACRVVLIGGYLPDADYARLVAVSAYTVNTSHGEGQCLPLMEAMSAGKPAVAPPHTGMADYLDQSCAFLVRSTVEPAAWPQDERSALRTHRRRIDLASLEAAYRRSFDVAAHDTPTYDAMSAAAVERLRAHCSAALTEQRLRDILEPIVIAPVDEEQPQFEARQVA